MTPLTLWGVVLVCWIVCHVSHRRHWIWSVPLVVLLATIDINTGRGVDPHYLCCDAAQIENSFLKRLNHEQRAQRLFRPTVVIADLGVISWQKKFNIVDLAFLGSPIMTALKGEREAIADYFFEFAAPDIVQMHKSWACLHYQLQTDPRFKERYQPIRQRRDPWLQSHCRQHEQVKTGVWLRKNVKKGKTTRERALIDTLRKRLTITPLRTALEECQKEEGFTACLYVTRTVYRFLPELERAGLLTELRELFARTKSARYDLAILRSRRDGSWHKDAVDAIRMYTSTRKKKSDSPKSGDSGATSSPARVL